MIRIFEFCTLVLFILIAIESSLFAGGILPKDQYSEQAPGRAQLVEKIRQEINSIQEQISLFCLTGWNNDEDFQVTADRNEELNHLQSRLNDAYQKMWEIHSNEYTDDTLVDNFESEESELNSNESKIKGDLSQQIEPQKYLKEDTKKGVKRKHHELSSASEESEFEYSESKRLKSDDDSSEEDSTLVAELSEDDDSRNKVSLTIHLLKTLYQMTPEEFLKYKDNHANPGPEYLSIVTEIASKVYQIDREDVLPIHRYRIRGNLAAFLKLTTKNGPRSRGSRKSLNIIKVVTIMKTYGYLSLEKFSQLKHSKKSSPNYRSYRKVCADICYQLKTTQKNLSSLIKYHVDRGFDHPKVRPQPTTGFSGVVRRPGSLCGKIEKVLAEQQIEGVLKLRELANSTLEEDRNKAQVAYKALYSIEDTNEPMITQNLNTIAYQERRVISGK